MTWSLASRCQLCVPAQTSDSNSDMHVGSASDLLMLGCAPVSPAVRMSDSKQLDSLGSGMKVVSSPGSFPAAVGRMARCKERGFHSIASHHCSCTAEVEPENT
ncbi:hypothetical protein NQZ68_032325 [Dissostichus eleginoides]|nr:hypothetical protein NQZ68_032325 [Dissostichus eleginoides]